MKAIRRLTDLMLQYSNAQARSNLHRFCYNAKINHWMRSQFQAHAAEFVDDFMEQQMRLLASYRLQSYYARARRKNWLSKIISDSDSWLSAGLSPEVELMQFGCMTKSLHC